MKAKVVIAMVVIAWVVVVAIFTHRELATRPGNEFQFSATYTSNK